MFANKNYERDIENVFVLNRFFSRMIGIWPFVHANSLLPELLETITVVLTCFVFIICELIPMLLYMFMVLTDISKRLKFMGSVVFTVVQIIKYVYMLLYRSHVRNCLMLVDADWRNVVNPSDRISMIDRIRIGKRLIVMCAVFVYLTGVALRMAIPLSMGKIVTPQNITIRPLSGPAYLIILDVQRSPVYEIVYFIQFLSGFIKYTITVATFSFVTLCAMHFCAQADILMTLMNDFINENRPEYLNRRLATVVERQIKIRNFLQLVQNITQYPSLAEVLGSSAMLCFAGYHIIMGWENHNIVVLCSYILALIMLMFNIFIYCYMGEQVIEQGEKIALTTCTLDWHRLPNTKARALILLITISEIPLKLKAGNFIELSLRTFGNITKMAVTYLNLIRSKGFSYDMTLLGYAGASELLITFVRNDGHKLRTDCVLSLYRTLQKYFHATWYRYELKEIRIKNCRTNLPLEMFANKYYERDIKNAFALNRFFFRVIGIWPFAYANSLLPELFETIALVLACFVFLICELIPMLLYVFMVLTDVRIRLKFTGSLIFTAVQIIKYVYMLLYRSHVRNCLMLVDADWRNVVNPSDYISMIDRVKIGKRLIVMCAVFVYLNGVALRMVIPLSMGKIVTPQNITIRPLPSAAYLIILDVQRSPVYEILYFIQFLAGFIKYTIIVACFGFVTLCAMHFCAQADILVTLMNDFVNENRPENLNKRLATVVEHQIRIRNFLQLVQSIAQYPSLVEVVGSSVMLCFAGYYIIMGWEDHNIIILCSYILSLIMLMFNIFIYCYMGEQIVEQGEKIALTTCTLDWHRLPNTKARALILLITISENPLKLKAGNFIDLSLKTFGNITKMAVTYLNLLRSV
ncbi:uncharacterized protein LOC105834984 [Monomorium pharaonis]|uniref:uncharacterized protein LOC105834984 n=1 Tax=Monomorium pharaonis TaxID=307658 RepID=UPI001746FDE2|nr:uncharacterized protein LOC105834984 [Monomorium pharaonis]